MTAMAHAGKHPLAGRAAVAGVGTTTFGRLPDYTSVDLGLWALREALDDCGLTYKDIDGLIVNRIDDYRSLGESCGMDPRYTLSTPGHGRFSGICIQTAAALIASACSRFLISNVAFIR